LKEIAFLVGTAQQTLMTTKERPAHGRQCHRMGPARGADDAIVGVGMPAGRRPFDALEGEGLTASGGNACVPASEVMDSASQAERGRLCIVATFPFVQCG